MALEPETQNPSATPPKRGRGRPRKTTPAHDGQTQALDGRAGASRTQEEVIEPDNAIWLTNAIALKPSTCKKGTPRDRIAAWCMLRALEPDITIKEASKRIGVSKNTLHRDVLRAVSEGWLRFDNTLDQMRYEVVPKVVRNLNAFLDQGDRTVTIEAAKGTVFKQFQEAEGINDKQTTVLALKIELPDSGEVRPITGQIVGTPRVLTMSTDE